jgi:hypothetical protein
VKQPFALSRKEAIERPNERKKRLSQKTNAKNNIIIIQWVNIT